MRPNHVAVQHKAQPAEHLHFPDRAGPSERAPHSFSQIFIQSHGPTSRDHREFFYVVWRLSLKVSFVLLCRPADRGEKAAVYVLDEAGYVKVRIGASSNACTNPDNRPFTRPG
jgi:hypothetical protein